MFSTLALTKLIFKALNLQLSLVILVALKKLLIKMENPTFLASHREYTVFLAELSGKKVVVCSTGIGGPSTSIAVEELAQLGVTTFLRVGTTGAIQSHINVVI
eukprot:TRINITY_DN15779_c0_g1_i1.p1 TRINITY_DN15779_c0_g1~~TRINITY_DN15779_c0_g1_i1.p1  ORF type:complete len:103 (+),score=11.28 TRINITY_DN15779_c0_g1_i1:313-621(+)